VGIPSAGDLRKGFGGKFHGIERDSYFDIQSIAVTFYIRGESGSAAPMSFFELRDQMLHTSRMRPLTSRWRTRL
jgi:hypothetical protein